MKPILPLLTSTIQYYEASILINSIKSNKLFLNIFKIFIITFFINSIIFLPFLIFSNFFYSLNTLIILSSFFLFFIYFYFIIKTRTQELLDKKIIRTSLAKVDFLNYLKNNKYFNFIISLIVSLFIFIYQVIIYVLLLIINVNSNILLITLFQIASILFYTAISYLSFLIYYSLNHDKKALFIKIDSYRKTDQRAKKLKVKKFVVSTNKKLKYFNINIDIRVLLNLIKSIKVIYPILSALIFFSVISFLNYYLDYSLNIRIITSMIFGLYFSFPMVNNLNKYDSESNLLKPFIHTLFIFSIILVLSLFSIVRIKLSNGLIFNLNELFNPYIQWINGIFININDFINSLNIISIFFLPLIFFMTFYLIKKTSDIFHKLSQKIDFKLRDKLTKRKPSIIFGDSISLYPFIINLIVNVIILNILFISIIPLTNFFNNLFITFQVADIFKIKFINYYSIKNLFNLIYFIFLIIIISKLIIQFISSFLSHLILFNDELIYYENKIYRRTILRIPLTKISYIIVKQNIFEKILDIGSIFIETIDKNGLIRIKGISSIKEKDINHG